MYIVEQFRAYSNTPIYTATKETEAEAIRLVAFLNSHDLTGNTFARWRKL